MPKMIIAIEGPDNVGKTTIAKYLRNKLGFKYKHFTKPKSKEAAEREYMDFLDEDGNYVVDRFWPGEYVYGPMFRGYNPDFQKRIENKMRENDIRILYILIAISETKMRSFPSMNGEEILSRHNEVMFRFSGVLGNVKYGHVSTVYADGHETIDSELDCILSISNIFVSSNLYKHSIEDPRTIIVGH